MREEKYYYIRDIDNRPIVTVCLIKESNNIARGVAICSKQDQPCKAVGRKIAKARASYALNSQGVNLEIRRIKRFLSVGYFKSVFKPLLTDREVRLFAKENK